MTSGRSIHRPKWLWPNSRCLAQKKKDQFCSKICCENTKKTNQVLIAVVCVCVLNKKLISLKKETFWGKYGYIL